MVHVSSSSLSPMSYYMLHILQKSTFTTEEFTILHDTYSSVVIGLLNITHYFCQSTIISLCLSNNRYCLALYFGLSFYFCRRDF